MELSAFRPSRLWKRMPADKRLDAAELFWADEDSSDQQVEAVAALASHMKFRTKSILSLPIDRKARYLVTLPNMPDTVAARALVNYHLARQRPMMGAFLDALGIAHENGLISDEELKAPDPEGVKTAAMDIAARFPADDVSLYFGTLVSQDPETWSPLAELAQTTPVTRQP